jgi:toxin-antitoxin system PIN domain toxin
VTAPPARPVLPDANVLVALADASHVHHAAAVRWFDASDAPFATCPITQGALVRVLLRTGAVADVTVAIQVLKVITQHTRHHFWPDDLDYSAVRWTGVLGHRQVTDAYLAALARRHSGRLATFDQGLASLHADAVIAVPV